MTTKLHETEGQKKSCCYFYLQTWHYQHCWSQQYAGSEGLRFDSLWRLGIFSLSHAHEKTNTSFSMLIIVNNLHEKCIAESQEWQNFGSVHAICNFHLSYMKNALVFSQSDMCNFCIYVITTQRYLILSTESELIMWIGHHVEFLSWSCECLPFIRTKSLTK